MSGTEPLTSSAKLEQQVKWVIYADETDAAEIDWTRPREAIRHLNDYAGHPHSADAVQRRAEEAIEYLRSTVADTERGDVE